jgi:hypothetical protein
MDRFGTILLRKLLGSYCLCLTPKALGEPVGRVTRFHPNRKVPFVMTDPLPSNQVGLESVGPSLFPEPRGTGVI